LIKSDSEDSMVRKQGNVGRKLYVTLFPILRFILYGFAGYAYFNVLRGVLVEEETLGNLVFSRKH